jgi:hypothetical protein
MELLRSQTEIAVNELAVACMEAADIHESAAHACEEPALADKLNALARSRREICDLLAAYLTEHYGGPNWPEQERELIKKAAARVKSALSPEGIGSLLSDCLAEEERVREAACAAHRQEEISPSVRDRIAKVEEDAASQVRWLQDSLRGAQG